MTKGTLIWRNSSRCVIDAVAIDTTDTSDELVAALVNMITNSPLEMGDSFELSYDTAETKWVHPKRLAEPR